MYRKEKGHVPILATKIGQENVVVTRAEVSGYVNDPEFLYYLSVYQYTELWGLPNGHGWANEPTDILEGITALKIEARLIENEQMESARGKSSGSAPPVRSVPT